MIWETQTLVTDDSAFGRMTSALTFIKLTQRTDCAMNWSQKPVSAPGGEALRWTLAKAPSSMGLRSGAAGPAQVKRAQGRFLQVGALGQRAGEQGRLWALTPQVNQVCPLLPHEASCGREEMFQC